jgi:hypothetical protein
MPPLEMSREKDVRNRRPAIRGSSRATTTAPTTVLGMFGRGGRGIFCFQPASTSGAEDAGV